MHTLLLYLSILLMSLLCKLQIIFTRLTQFLSKSLTNFTLEKSTKHFNMPGTQILLNFTHFYLQPGKI